MEGEQRGDLEGLRGLALALVTAHHFGALPGGFVGVDVFLVLSGFLVTASLLRGAPSYALFVARRLRRLAPAAAATVLLVLAAAHVLALPRALAETRAAAAAAALRAANLYFCFGRDEGYFSAIGSPLLHLWSLAVEEQFYLVWPLLLPLLRVRPGLLLPPLVAASVAAAHLLPAATAYFLLPARLGELASGAALALAPPPPLRGGGAAGLALVGLSAALLGPEMPFPGVLAVPPCLGAALVIASSPEAAANRLLARLLGPLGTVSYSFYLLHYPLLFFAREQLQLTDAAATLLQLLAMALGAALMYRFVETPFRALKWSPGKTLLLLGLLPVALLLAAAAVPPLAPPVTAVPGAANGLPTAEPLPAAAGKDWRSLEFALGVECAPSLPHVCMDVCGARMRCWHKESRCLKTGSAEQCWTGAGTDGRGPEAAERLPAVLLLGDSHAAQYLPLLEEFAAVLPFRVLNWQFNACPPLLAGRGFAALQRLRMFPGCDEFMRLALEQLVPRFAAVALGGMWAQYAALYPDFEGLLFETVEALRARNVTVMLLGQVPFFPAFPNSKGDEGCPLALPPAPEREGLRVRGCFAAAPMAPNRSIRQRAERSRVLFFDASPGLCPRGRCTPYLDGLRAYWHKDHLTYGAARLLGRRLLERGVPAPVREWVARARPAALPPAVSYYAFVDGQ